MGSQEASGSQGGVLPAEQTSTQTSQDMFSEEGDPNLTRMFTASPFLS